MSLKKRMFRSNMTIIFLSLFSLLAVVFLVLIVFEDSIERRFFTMEQAKLDDSVTYVLSLVQGAETQDIEELQKEADKIGYKAALISGEQVIKGYAEEQMWDLAGRIDTEYLQNNEADIFYYLNSTAVVKYIPKEDACIVAVHFAKRNWLKSSLLHSYKPLLLVLLISGISMILVLLALSSYFTKRMSRVVMEPLEKLMRGAKRIQAGNLKEEISYHGEEEFENLCQTFNTMQKTILEDQEQRIRTEKARTDMVTGISHDLRTPLTSIQGYIKGIIDGVANSPEKRMLYLRTAYESTEDMNRLLQKLFDFSRMESGQMPFRMVKVDLGELTDSCVAQKEALIDVQKVCLSFHKEEGIPEILLDVEQFRRIFDNLLENSIKYTAVCPVKIHIRISHSSRGVVLEWTDNGPGVPTEKIDRIFERFYRCDEARKQKGSGVGLYVVKYIMERHGGRIWAENDGGLKLTLTFPIPGEE